jgi:hypothetical protein
VRHFRSDEADEDSEDRFARSYLKELQLEKADMSFAGKVGGGKKSSSEAVKIRGEKMKKSKRSADTSEGDGESESESESETERSEEEEEEEEESLHKKREKKKKKRKKGADYWLEDAENGDIASQYEVFPSSILHHACNWQGSFPQFPKHSEARHIRRICRWPRASRRGGVATRMMSGPSSGMARLRQRATRKPRWVPSCVWPRVV